MMDPKPSRDDLCPSRDREGAGLVAARDTKPLTDVRGSEKPGRGSDVLAYFITFHTYGTWLHGREQGSVDRTHNQPGTPVLDPDAVREQEEFARLKRTPVMLDAAMRGVVDGTIREVCAHRGWTLHALNVRTNHVHAVVTASAPAERVLNDFKAYATRRLVAAGCVAAKSRVWSRHGSTLYLWTEFAVAEKCQYVINGQGVDLS